MLASSFDAEGSRSPSEPGPKGCYTPRPRRGYVGRGPRVGVGRTGGGGGNLSTGTETRADPAIEPAGDITLADALRARARIVDVRSPREFAEDHVPGARNVPLLADEERAVVGMLYRERGPAVARAWGEARVVARLEPFLTALCRALDLPGSTAGAGAPRVICCARGGERSAATAALLQSHGHRVLRLTGGYRSHRAHVRSRLASLRVPRPILLDGLTGSGKTAVLRAIAELHPGRVLDLEGLAGHRSSLLGDVGLAPVSQKRFESALVAASEGLSGPYTLIEAESRRIGDREIPAALFESMRTAPRIELVATEAQRIAHLCEEYLTSAGVEEIIARLPGLAAYPRIGPDGVHALSALLRRGEVEEAVRVLLREHYDPRYRHGREVGEPTASLERGSTSETARRLVDLIESGVGASSTR